MAIISTMQNTKSQYLELATPVIVILTMATILIIPGWFEIVSQWLSRSIENKLYWIGASGALSFWVIRKFNDIKNDE